MPKNLKRVIGRGDLHFITFCCYQRRPLLASARARNLAVQILKDVRARYGFALVGYVIMPEHLHLLISESALVAPSKMIQVFKQRLSRRMRARKRTLKGQLRLRFPEQESLLRRFWQRRYYDFNVYSRAKVLEKLHYMHSNPVREKLVGHPGDWPWSSWCSYYRGEGLIAIDPWNSLWRRFPASGSKEKSGPPFQNPKGKATPEGSWRRVTQPTTSPTRHPPTRERKRIEKLNYMHANPINRKLVKDPKDWPWSSWGFYAGTGKVLVPMDIEK